MIHAPYERREDAAAYVAWRRRHAGRRVSRRFEEWRVRRWAAQAGRLLDMPCGAGRFEARASCDRSAGMCALAREAGARAVRGDAFALPFGDGAFDTALCVRLLHHFDAADRRRILAELARVARRAVVTYFGTTGLKARRRARKTRRGTRRAVATPDFAADCAAAGWRVLRDAAVIPGWGEQRLVLLERTAS